MSEDHDSKLADLYRQSSQETPPAHIDCAVMERARESVRRRAYSPFGNHWVAGGAMAAVVMLSVLLFLAVPPQLDHSIPDLDVVAPSDDLQQLEMLKKSVPSRPLQSEPPARAEEKRDMPAAPGSRFDFYRALPGMEGDVLEEEVRARRQQAPAAKESTGSAATAPAETYYLHAGSFREQARALALQTKLAELGFRSEIRKVSMGNTEVFHRVRVGPFTDHIELEKSIQKLIEQGIETQTVKVRE